MSDDGIVFLGGGDAPADATALKERAADALERALGFVREHGDHLAVRCAHVALRAIPAAELADAVSALQRSDGSFEPVEEPCRGWLARALAYAGAEAPVRDTLVCLALLADARQEDAPSVERAIRFLEARQQPDGSFPTTSSAPDAAVVVTGIAAGSLGRSRFTRPEILSLAGDWLGERFDPDLVEQSPTACTAVAMYYANAPDERSDEVMQWCGRALEKGFRSHALEALAVLQTLLACQVGSLPGASFAPEELLERLLSEQAGDGGFDALQPDGARGRVAPTVDAMRAVIGLCATF